jgi:hypothetical protein
LIRWQPPALIGFVLALPSLGFFGLFAVRIGPAFAGMMRDLGGTPPFITRVVLHPWTPFIIMGALGASLLAGILRQNERALIMPLTAAAGFLLSLGAVAAVYLPIFTLAANIK